MSKVQTVHSPIDERMLFLLRTLHDVQGIAKSKLYRNTSERLVLECLIESNFIDEMPTPFSNKRTCVITERGKALFESMVAVNTIWVSNPESKVILKVSNEFPDEVPTEPIAKSDEGTLEVPLSLEGEEQSKQNTDNKGKPSIKCAGCGTHISFMTADTKNIDEDMDTLKMLGFLKIGDEIYCPKCRGKVHKDVTGDPKEVADEEASA